MEQVTLGSGRSYYWASPKVGEAPWPVVVFLHGTGGSAVFGADETRLVPFAAEAGFVVAFGEGLPVRPTEPIRFLSNPQRWNDGSLTAENPFFSNTDDVGYLTELILDLLQRANGDSKRVFLTGFSNGAGMTFRFAAERGELLAAIAPVAGYCPPSLPTPTRSVPTLFIIGDADLLVPPAGGLVRLPWGNRTLVRPPIQESLGDWATKLGCSAQPVTVENQAGLMLERYPSGVDSEFTKLTVAGLGHHWPGGMGQFNPRIGGPVSNRQDANREIWSFFRKHRLD